MTQAHAIVNKLNNFWYIYTKSRIKKLTYTIINYLVAVDIVRSIAQYLRVTLLLAGVNRLGTSYLPS